MMKRLIYGRSAVFWLSYAPVKYVLICISYDINEILFSMALTRAWNFDFLSKISFIYLLILSSFLAPGAFSKWCSRDDSCTHDWNFWSFWYGDVGERAGNTQVLHQRIWHLLHKWGLFPFSCSIFNIFHLFLFISPRLKYFFHVAATRSELDYA